MAEKHEHLEVQLTPTDRRTLESFVSKGMAPARVLNRARLLLMLDAGYSMYDIESALLISHGTVWRIGRRYNAEGLENALLERPRPGAERVLDEAQTQRFVAMVCAASPQGKPRWTTRLAAEEAVKRGICESMSRETARTLMKEHDLKPWREKNVVRAHRGSGVRHPHGGRA